jgi:hypothetical protein
VVLSFNCTKPTEGEARSEELEARRRKSRIAGKLPGKEGLETDHTTSDL